VPKAMGRGVKKKGTKRPITKSRANDFSDANARFDRLLEAMATTPALPKKKKRVVVPQRGDDDVFDD